VRRAYFLEILPWGGGGRWPCTEVAWFRKLFCDFARNLFSLQIFYVLFSGLPAEIVALVRKIHAPQGRGQSRGYFLYDRDIPFHNSDPISNTFSKGRKK
jgi:hypothetical protein